MMGVKQDLMITDRKRNRANAVRRSREVLTKLLLPTLATAPPPLAVPPPFSPLKMTDQNATNRNTTPKVMQQKNSIEKKEGTKKTTSREKNVPLSISLKHLRPPLWRRLATLLGGGFVQGVDVVLPLLEVGPLDAAVVGDEAVDLALDVGGLGPDAAAAVEEVDLLAELVEEAVGAVVVRLVVGVELVGLVDRVDGLLDVPEAEGNIHVSLCCCQ